MRVTIVPGKGLILDTPTIIEAVRLAWRLWRHPVKYRVVTRSRGYWIEEDSGQELNVSLDWLQIE